MTATLEVSVDGGDPPAIHLAGKLTLGPLLRTVGTKARSVLQSAHPAVLLLEVSGVTDVDSAGLGELVSLYTTATGQGCRVCLLRPAPKLQRQLESTRLIGILPCFEDAESASRWAARTT